MEISIVLKDNKRINAGQGIPITALHTGIELIPAGRNYCHWFPASPDDDIEGTNVLVSGHEYIVNRRRYNLSAGYAILARLTPKFTLIPRLRKAVGRETTVISDRRGAAVNEYWPVIESIYDTKYLGQ